MDAFVVLHSLQQHFSHIKTSWQIDYKDLINSESERFWKNLASPTTPWSEGGRANDLAAQTVQYILWKGQVTLLYWDVPTKKQNFEGEQI